MNVCIHVTDGNCTKAKTAGRVSLYFPDDAPGPVCLAHLPRPLWRETCSHSLAPSGACAYCGAPV